MDAELLNILCCPETHQKLEQAPHELVEKLNQRIASGDAKNRGGGKVTEKIEGGLVREDEKFIYPIRQNIPVLLVDEAIVLES